MRSPEILASGSCIPPVSSNNPAPGDDFSLVTGGPLYRCFLRARLARPPLDLLVRRMLVLPALLWLPLLVLSLLDGRAWGGVQCT